MRPLILWHNGKYGISILWWVYWARVRAIQTIYNNIAFRLSIITLNKKWSEHYFLLLLFGTLLISILTRTFPHTFQFFGNDIPVTRPGSHCILLNWILSFVLRFLCLLHEHGFALVVGSEFENSTLLNFKCYIYIERKVGR